MFVAIAAGVVGVAALAVSIYETHLMREQQRAEVWPILEAWSTFEPGRMFALNVANKGIGPAILKSVTVAVDGEPVQSWNEVLTRTLGTDSVDYGMSAVTGNVIAAGESVTLISLLSEDHVRSVWEASQRVSLELCYCSVFKECWLHSLANLRDGVPRTEETGACETKPSGGF